MTMNVPAGKLVAQSTTTNESTQSFLIVRIMYSSGDMKLHAHNPRNEPEDFVI